MTPDEAFEVLRRAGEHLDAGVLDDDAYDEALATIEAAFEGHRICEKNMDAEIARLREALRGVLSTVTFGDPRREPETYRIARAALGEEA